MALPSFKEGVVDQKFVDAITNVRLVSGTIRNVDVDNDTVKVNGSDLSMTCANIDTVVVTKTTTKFFYLDGGWKLDYAGTQIQALI